MFTHLRARVIATRVTLACPLAVHAHPSITVQKVRQINSPMCWCCQHFPVIRYSARCRLMCKLAGERGAGRHKAKKCQNLGECRATNETPDVPPVFTSRGERVACQVRRPEERSPLSRSRPSFVFSFFQKFYLMFYSRGLASVEKKNTHLKQRLCKAKNYLKATNDLFALKKRTSFKSQLLGCLNCPNKHI